MGCYCFTLAPITWVILSEIFPNRIRGAAMSVSVFSLWAACFAMALLYPTISEMIYAGRIVLRFYAPSSPAASFMS